MRLTLIASLFQSVLSLQTSFLTDSINLQDYTFTENYGLSDEKISQLFDLHKFLVSIPSVSYHEQGIGGKLFGYLRHKGLNVEKQDVGQGRFNILAYKGSINETKVLLTSHIDTVPPFFPYYLSDNGTKIHGRGTTDDKGSVASQIIAYLDILDELDDGDVSLLFDVGEENGGDGFKYVAEHIDYRWDTIIYGEPTENKLGIGHKGGYHGAINVTGKAAHSGYPELGINANKILIEFLYKLQSHELPYDNILGNSSLNVGLIGGGVAGNVISPNAAATLAFRVASDLESFPHIVQSTIEQTTGGEHIEFIGGKGISPIYFKNDIEGFEKIILGYGTDASAVTKTPPKNSILYGPGSIHVAHSAEEFVSTDDLIEAVDGYKRLIRESLK
ncbi:hypothetical protein WICMUC_004907 [Wickerhamomyces mucosus]|uniref:Peptidase M20 dimerisation domain-containing protein n=1 Tax=Wickerhamomyces mucosus TaxID=1378264 RepID=A0A9P8PF18_9ASCO|nr:hypothetical protein WICMUC_004907 [Wickerhamomyces mucosus]